MDDKLLNELRQIITDKKKDIFISIEDDLSVIIHTDFELNKSKIFIEPEYWKLEQNNVDVWIPMRNIKEVTYRKHPYDEEDEYCEYSIIYDSNRSIEFIIKIDYDSKPPFED